MSAHEWTVNLPDGTEYVIGAERDLTPRELEAEVLNIQRHHSDTGQSLSASAANAAGRGFVGGIGSLVEGVGDDGVSRWHKQEYVHEFLALCDLPMSMGGKFVPFCAAGLAYAACRAYCDIDPVTTYTNNDKERLDVIKRKLTTIAKHYFYTSAAVRVVRAKARSNGTFVGRDTNPKNGWLVVFGWNGNQTGNHIALVDGDHDSGTVINSTLLSY